jgi:hypothetical protein
MEGGSQGPELTVPDFQQLSGSIWSDEGKGTPAFIVRNGLSPSVAAAELLLLSPSPCSPALMMMQPPLQKGPSLELSSGEGRPAHTETNKVRAYLPLFTCRAGRGLLFVFSSP